MGQDQFGVNFLSTTSVAPEYILLILGVLVAFVAVFTFATYQYHKWKRYQQFVGEMKTLNLEPEEEGTLADMVKRYSMDEPVKILYSQRLYDEMASDEMIRILSSQGSADLKSDYIDSLYEIRHKTYSSDLIQTES